MANELTLASRLRRGGQIQLRSTLSPHGTRARKGKWHNQRTLNEYRRRRDEKRKIVTSR